MRIELTEQQQQAIDNRAEVPPRVIDPRSNAAYYLVPAPDYEAVRELLEEERRQKSIRAVGLRNAVGRIGEVSNVRLRIEKLKLLKHGWLDGQGLAPAHDGLDWLAGAFDLYFPDDLPPPYLYPTAEAGVRAEWSIKPYELSLDVDINARSGTWHSLNLDQDTDQSRNVNLNDAWDWEWLASEVRRLVAVTTFE